MIMMNDKSAIKILSENRYPEGANVPTLHIEYLCPCKNGKIIYERVKGFNDDYAYIECEECKEKYAIIMGRGYLWQLEKKK